MQPELQHRPTPTTLTPAPKTVQDTHQIKTESPTPTTLRAPRAKSSLVSRNVTIAGHRTSVRLEPEMWNGLAEVCRRECASMHEIGTVISAHKPSGTSLTAAIRVFVMAYFRAAATEDGHNRSGHGPGGHLMMSMRSREAAKR